MHRDAQYAGEFIMQNNSMPPFHLINFLVSESWLLQSFPRMVCKFFNGSYYSYY